MHSFKHPLPPKPATVIRLPASFKRTKEDQVADFLRERIIWGFYSRGQRLKQAEVAEMLEISITPVREALKILEAEGYVVGTSHKGAGGAPFQIERTEELLQLRVLLELRLTKAALAIIDSATLAELTALNAETEAAAHINDRDVTRRTNYHFHFTLYELANQPQTLHFVRVLWAKYPFDKLTAMPDRLSDVAAEHEAILAAARAGDIRAALKAMQFHIENGWREFKRNFPLYDQTVMP
ncbi:MAG: GntR family transcriptional regulator [Alphaproteobacteria bacterium]|nr:GntR family transcriptional regulator [Alphaproteobacteria bacterium]